MDMKSRLTLVCAVIVLLNNLAVVSPHPVQATDLGIGGIAPHNAVIIYQGRQYVVNADQLFAKLHKSSSGFPSPNGGTHQPGMSQLPTYPNTPEKGRAHLPQSGQFLPFHGKMPSFQPGTSHLPNGGQFPPFHGKMPSFQPGTSQFPNGGQFTPSSGKMPSFQPGTSQLSNGGQFAPSSGKMPSFQPETSHLPNGGQFTPPNGKMPSAQPGTGETGHLPNYPNGKLPSYPPKPSGSGSWPTHQPTPIGQKCPPVAESNGRRPTQQWPIGKVHHFHQFHQLPARPVWPPAGGIPTKPVQSRTVPSSPFQHQMPPLPASHIHQNPYRKVYKQK